MNKYIYIYIYIYIIAKSKKKKEIKFITKKLEFTIHNFAKYYELL
jgi:hypothetical protein